MSWQFPTHGKHSENRAYNKLFLYRKYVPHCRATDVPSLTNNVVPDQSGAKINLETLLVARNI